jgi:hypothetical protein
MAPYPTDPDWHFVMLTNDRVFWFAWIYTGPEWSRIL